MDRSLIDRSPIGAAARAVGRVTFGAAETIRAGAMVFTRSRTYGWQVILGRTSRDYASQIGDPARNSIVASVVGWIARNFPEAPVQITHLVDGAIVGILRSATGPGAMLKLLERPNRYYSGVLMWMATVMDFYTSGNAYWLKQRAPSGRVVGLWWAPRQTMKPAWPADRTDVFISHYEYTVDGIVYEIPEQDVVHFRDGIDPNNTRLGLSKLASLFREIFTDDEAANFTASLLTNLGVPGVILAPSNTGMVQGRVDPETIKKTFMEKFGGDKRGEPMVLTSPTDVKVLSWSPEQMNLKELRRIPEERISGVLGVAAVVAGLGAGLDRSTFTNFGEARKAAYEESVIPMQRLLAAELEVQLLPEFASEDQIEREGMDVAFDIRNVRALQESVDAIWRRHESAATKGLITRKRFKQAIGEPTTDADNVYVIPNNYMLIEPDGGNQPPGRRQTAIVTGADELPQLSATEPLQLTTSAVRCSGCGKMLAQRKGQLVGGALEVKCPRCGLVNDAAA